MDFRLHVAPLRLGMAICDNESKPDLPLFYLGFAADKALEATFLLTRAISSKLPTMTIGSINDHAIRKPAMAVAC